MRARTFATKGSYLTSSCSAAATTLNVFDTSDFAASGTAYILEGGFGSYGEDTGKTASTLTGVSGALAHATNVTIIPAVKCLVVDANTNEMHWYAADDSGTVKRCASIGVSALDAFVGLFGFAGSTNALAGLSARSGSGRALDAVAVTGTGVMGSATSAGGVGVAGSADSANGTSVWARCANGNVAVYIEDYPTLPAGSHLGASTFAAGMLACVLGNLRYYDGGAWKTIQTRGTHYFSAPDAGNVDSISFNDGTDTVSLNCDNGLANANLALASLTASGDINVTGHVTGAGDALSLYPGNDTGYLALWGGSSSSVSKGGFLGAYGYKNATTTSRGGVFIQSANRDTADAAIGQSLIILRSMDAASSIGSQLFYTDSGLALEIDNAQRLKSTSTLAAATASGTALVIEATTGRISRTSSSLRYKRDVEPADRNLLVDIGRKLAKLLIWYRSACEQDNRAHSFWGMPAEDVAALDPRLASFGYPLVKRFVAGDKPMPAVIDDFGTLVSKPTEGTPDSFELAPDSTKPLQPESLHYDRMVVPLFALVDYQQEVIDAQQRQIDDLAARLQKIEQLIGGMAG